jgi:PAS domain S-box-containing protein
VASVVVAEDNVDHQRVIAEVVRRMGHEVRVTGDGRTALAAVVAHPPDLVIADVDMPHLDGLALCRAVRAQPGLAGIPVVLVTAYLPPGDGTQSYAEATAVVHKPFSISELAAALRPLLADARPTPPPGPERTFTGADPAFVEALLRSLDTGVAACDTAGRLVVFNQMLRDMFGDVGEAVPVDEWPRRFRLRHHDGTALLSHETALSRALAGEHVQNADMMVDDAAGRPRWFMINARPIRDGDGTLLGAVAAVHETTTEHRARQYQTCKTEVLKVLAAESDTATAAARILTAIGATLDWPYLRLWLVDKVTGVLRPAGTYTAPGEQALPTPAGVPRGTGMAGRCWEEGELIWVPDIRAADSPVLPEVAGKTAFRAGGAVPVLGGEEISGVLTFFSHNQQEPDPALAVLLTGIAGMIGAHLERRRADVLSMHLAAATDEYIALVGHELRTPLTSIGSYIDLIAESPDTTAIGDVRDLLEVVQRNNVRLRTLVERLLDLAALESGHGRLSIAEVDLAGVVGAGVSAVSRSAAQRRISIETRLPASLILPGDADRLRQVVDSLLDNAIKFSPEGAAVDVGLTEEAGAAVLRIRDHGIGVPAEAAPELFRRLFRAGNVRHTGIPGAGLGLALSRVVVERHRGTITLNPERTGGTSITVRLPLAAEPDAAGS